MGDNDVQVKMNEMLDKLVRLERTAYHPVVEESDGPLTVSKFSGTPWLAPDEQWPLCPRCKDPMPFFFQLNLAEIPQELQANYGDSGLLQLFYCIECEDYSGWEPFADVHLARIVKPTADELKQPQIPLPERKHNFPTKTIIGWQTYTELPELHEYQDNSTLELTAEELEMMNGSGLI